MATIGAAAGPMGLMHATFNKFVQVRKARPVWECTQLGMHWQAILTVPGVGGIVCGQASNQKAAKEMCIAQFLTEQGVVPGGPVAPGAGNVAVVMNLMPASAPEEAGPDGGNETEVVEMPAEAVPRTPGFVGGGSTGGPAPALAQPEWMKLAEQRRLMELANPSPMNSNQAVDRELQSMLAAMRKGRPDEALETATKYLSVRPRSISLKQATTLAGAVSLRTPLVEALALFEGLRELDVIAFPDEAAKAYYIRHVRWAAAEFITQGSLAKQRSRAMQDLVYEGECMTHLRATRAKGPTEFHLTGSVNWSISKFQKGDYVYVTCPPDGEVGVPPAKPVSNVAKAAPGPIVVSPAMALGPRGVANPTLVRILSPAEKAAAGTGLWQPAPLNNRLIISGFRGSFEGELMGTIPGGFHVKLVTSAGEGDIAPGLDGQLVRLDRAANRICYMRQLDALKALADSAVPTKEVPLLADANSWLRQTLLAQDAGSELGFEASVTSQCPQFYALNVEEKVRGVVQTVSHLTNPSQEEALRIALTRRLTLIQGPPGTGKTHTSVLLMHLWVHLGRGPILATAESNVAVDNLVAGLLSAGIQVVRLGRPEVTAPHLEEHTLEGRVAKATGRRGAMHEGGWGEAQRILKSSQVICATCSGSFGAFLDNIPFGAVLVDEAAQATEVATLLPLLRLHPNGVVCLVGDHRQLPPTTYCHEIQMEGASQPLFDRLVLRGIEPVMLSVQYRMHPAIAEFSATQYYEGRLLNGVGGADRPAPNGFNWPVPAAGVAFVQVQGRGEWSVGTSFQNADEAEIVSTIVKNLLASVALGGGGLTPADVGVISPYSAQVRLLKRQLGQSVEVSSVDGFQGREKEVIIITTVRCNRSGSIGFLSDPRRLNVAMTRAKRGLIVCGDANTLIKDAGCWGPWLQWADSFGFVLGSDSTAVGVPARLAEMEALVQPKNPFLGDNSAAFGVGEHIEAGEVERIMQILSGVEGGAGDEHLDQQAAFSIAEQESRKRKFEFTAAEAQVQPMSW